MIDKYKPEILGELSKILDKAPAALAGIHKLRLMAKEVARRDKEE